MSEEKAGRRDGRAGLEIEAEAEVDRGPVDLAVVDERPVDGRLYDERPLLDAGQVVDVEEQLEPAADGLLKGEVAARV